MKKPIDNGGPAFPYGEANFTDKFSQGMTLRDYFAAAALQGMIAHHGDPMNRKEMAVRAYLSADAMLAARKEGA
jgi:hypothetical protein